MTQLANKDLFEQYRNILSDWIPTGASIAIAVNDTYVYYASGHENISLQVGTAVTSDSMAYRVLRDRKKIDAIMDSSLSESPYYAIGYPITLHNLPAALIVILPPLFQINKKQSLEFLTGKINEDFVPVAIEEISYIESLQKKTWFYREKEQFKTNVTLKELQTKLPNFFIRIHRSYIINIRQIKAVSKDLSSNYIVRLKNDVALPISQSYLNSFREALQI